MNNYTRRLQTLERQLAVENDLGRRTDILRQIREIKREQLALIKADCGAHEEHGRDLQRVLDVVRARRDGSL